jgi:F-type H+-transporting ATPase subunit a
MQDPLEQFASLRFSITDGDTAFNTVGLFLLANTVLMGLLFAAFNPTTKNSYDFLLRNMYLLVRSIVKENLYVSNQAYFAPIFYLFMTILLANVVGLLPFSFTVTSSFVVTFFLSLLHFMGVNFIGVFRHM